MTIAYEPVWAIGTGKNATPAQAQAVHVFIRGLLGDAYGGTAAGSVRLLYPGKRHTGQYRPVDQLWKI